VGVPLTASNAGIVIAVRVIPRRGRTEVGGVRGDALLVRLAAAPVDGAANEALIAFFADLFNRPRRDIAIVSGHQSRNKRIGISGLSESQVAARLDAILTP
jgi:uncharacterized protein (TIGR00251 family)